MEISTPIKYATATVSLLVVMSGGLWALDSRYASDKDVAKSLSMFDAQVARDFEKVDIKILNLKYEKATEDYYNLRKLLRLHPDDQELAQELEDVTNTRNDLKVEIDKLL